MNNNKDLEGSFLAHFVVLLRQLEQLVHIGTTQQNKSTFQHVVHLRLKLLAFF